MLRTIISIDETDKKWIDQKAAKEKKTMTEIIRQAIQFYRDSELKRIEFEKLTEKTKGIWKNGDGLKYEKAIRKDWENRS